MDIGIIVGLILAVLFFGSITWLIIHVRLQDRKSRQDEHQSASEDKPAPQKLKAS